MIQVEADTGVTFEEVGIELSQDYGQAKTFCPRCHGNRKNAADRELSVDIDNGTWMCHHAECGWTSGLAAEGAKRGIRGAAPRAVRSGPVKQFADPRPLPEGLDPWALKYFADRKISERTLKAFGVRSSEKLVEGVPTRFVHLPFFSGEKHVNSKHRAIEAGGEPIKKFYQDSGTVRTMFGMNVCPPDARAFVIVEGEIDALSCYEVGWQNVLSLPDGAGNIRALDNPDVAALIDAAEIVVIATDADEPGRSCAAKLIERIDPVKCWLVAWPQGINDANALLVRDGMEALDAALGAARPVDLPGVHYFDQDFDRVLKLYEQGSEPGASTGWETLDQLYTLHKGTVTVVTGVPSHGKTSLVVAMLMNAVRFHGWKGAMFSPEMGTPATILVKLAQIVADAPVLPNADVRMSRDELRQAMEWVAERIWLIDASHRDEESYATIGLIELLARAEQCHLRHGIDFLLLDPWNRLDAARPRNMNETEYVAYALNAIGRFARRHNVWVGVVAHPTKQEAGKSGEQEAMPTPYSIAGSAHWYAMADFILGVHREKYDEERKGITTVRTWKVREEGDQGGLGQSCFRFDPRRRRFYSLDIAIPDRVGIDPFMHAAAVTA